MPRQQIDRDSDRQKEEICLGNSCLGNRLTEIEWSGVIVLLSSQESFTYMKAVNFGIVKEPGVTTEKPIDIWQANYQFISIFLTIESKSTLLQAMLQTAQPPRSPEKAKGKLLQLELPLSSCWYPG